MKNEINNQSDVTNYLQNNPAVMLYFYNNDCTPCISLRPKVEKLIAASFPLMEVIWVNSKEQPEIPAHYGVFANPTLLLFFDGKETRRFSKFVSVDELAQSIERYYKMIF